LTRVIGPSFPRDWGEVTGTPRTPGTLLSELQWTCTTIAVHSDKIEKFIRLRNEFETAILTSDLPLANEIIDSTEAALGVSIWLAEARMLTAELSIGLTANRKVLSAIHQAGADPIALFIAQFGSMRADVGVSPAAYAAHVMLCTKEVSRIAGESFANFTTFRSKLFLARNTSKNDLADILCHEARFPLVDRYVGVLRIIDHIAHADWFDTAAPELETVASLLTIRGDRKLDIVRFCHGNPDSIAIDTESKSVLPILHSYTIGQQTDAAIAAGEVGKQYPHLLELYEILSKTGSPPGVLKSKSSSSKLTASLATSMSKMLSLSGTDAKAKQGLEKIALQLAGTRFGSSLEAFCVEHSAEGIPSGGTPLRLYNSGCYTPRMSSAIQDIGKSRRLLNLLVADDPENAATRLFLDISESVASGKIVPLSPKLPDVRFERYMGLMYARLGLYNRAVPHYQRAFHMAQSETTKAECLIALLSAYVGAGMVAEAAYLVVDNAIAQRNPFTTLHLQKVFDALEAHPDASLTRDPALPILAHLYYQSVPTAREAEHVFIRLDDLLIAHGVDRPSELEPIVTKFDEQRIVYLLRHVCVPPYLDSSVTYESTEDLENERIFICRLLSRIDSPNASAYSEEVSQLAKRAIIRGMVRQVDSSKIYVDGHGIRQSLGPKHREAYDQYRRMMGLHADLRRLLLLSNDSNVLVFVDAGLAAFQSLFAELARLFLSSNEYGLDSYLSVRIRHGTLSGQLRTPFERHKLITRRDKEGEYSSNLNWLDMFEETYGASAAGVIDRGLKLFSAEIDATIDTIKDQWIHIESEAKPDAMFRYEYDDKEWVDLRIRFEAAATYEEFIDLCFDELWEKTRANLANVRTAVRGEAIPKLTDSLNRLLQVVEDASPMPVPHWFRDAIAACRTEVQREGDIVAEWFTTSAESVAPDFELAVGIDTTVEVLKQTFAVTNLGLEQFVTTVPRVRGEFFRQVVDVLYILLENIVKHGSNDTSNPVIRADVQGDFLVIEVSNALRPEADSIGLRADIPELEARVNRYQAEHNVRREGKSGYYKLGKILKHDLKRRLAHIRIVITEEDRFELVLYMELEGLCES
jgi:hypothetical protein